MQRAVKAKAKINLRSSIIVQNLDICCSRSYCPSYNTYSKMQIQGSRHKNSPNSDPSNNKVLKPALSHSNVAEPAQKEDKKKSPQSCRREPNIQSPATSVNINPPKRKEIGVTLMRLHISTALKKAIMSATAPSHKISISLGNFCAGN